MFLFSALTMRAVGEVAQTVVEEVRRQLTAFPGRRKIPPLGRGKLITIFAVDPLSIVLKHLGIMTGTQKPDYSRCVSIVASASLKKMVKPGMLAVCFPVCNNLNCQFLIFFRFIHGFPIFFCQVFVGILFSKMERFTSDQDGLLGARAVLAVLVFATCTGILTSLFLNNAGGAWDNGKDLCTCKMMYDIAVS